MTTVSRMRSRKVSSGCAVTRAEIERDVERMFSGNFRACVAEGVGVLAAESF